MNVCVILSLSCAHAALQKKPEEINRRSADMWSFAVLLWELVTREVPFADLSNMEIGMKVRPLQFRVLEVIGFITTSESQNTSLSLVLFFPECL